jgi:MFS family permease
MVGGTIADIWSESSSLSIQIRPNLNRHFALLPYLETLERGLPMGVYAFAAMSGGSVGPIVAGWIEQNRSLEWRWIQ